MFKNIDKKFEEIGFIKVSEDKYGAFYERYDKEHNFTQVLAIVYKANGNHVIQSYDRDLFDEDCMGNVCVGLTYYETKLALKKMKKMGYNKR